MMAWARPLPRTASSARHLARNQTRFASGAAAGAGAAGAPPPPPASGDEPFRTSRVDVHERMAAARVLHGVVREGQGDDEGVDAGERGPEGGGHGGGGGAGLDAVRGRASGGLAPL